MFCSNPAHEESRLRLKDEYEAIFDALDNSTLTVVQEPDRAPHQLPNILDSRGPYIVHVSGHGDKSGRLEWVHEDGKPYTEHDEFAQIFSTYEYAIKCVVLNACHSAEQARLLSRHVDYVVGTTDKIRDGAAIEFSRAFYKGFVKTRNIASAFQRGRNSIPLTDRDGAQILRLYKDGEECTAEIFDNDDGADDTHAFSLAKIETYRSWVLEKLAELLEGDAGLAEHLCKACEEWEQASRRGNLQLARALVDQRSISEFGRLMYGRIGAAREADDPCDRAGTVVEVFELAFPVVVARHVRRRMHEGNLPAFNTKNVKVFESIRSFFEIRRMTWRRDDNTRWPHGYVDLHGPESGPHDQRRRKRILEGWLARRPSLLSEIGDLEFEEQFEYFDEWLSYDKEDGIQPYGVSQSLDTEEFGFLLRLREDLPHLEVMLSEIRDPEAKQLDRKAVTALLRIYKAYDEITSERS